MDKKRKLKIASNVMFYTGLVLTAYYLIRFFTADTCLVAGGPEARFFTAYIIVTGVILVTSLVLEYFSKEKKAQIVDNVEEEKD